MAQLFIYNQDYLDYYASMFFSHKGFRDMKFSMDGKNNILVTGLTPDGKPYEKTIEPHINAITDDLKNFPETINDFIFRVTYKISKDPETGKDIPVSMGWQWRVLNPRH